METANMETVNMEGIWKQGIWKQRYMTGQETWHQGDPDMVMCLKSLETLVCMSERPPDTRMVLLPADAEDHPPARFGISCRP